MTNDSGRTPLITYVVEIYAQMEDKTVLPKLAQLNGQSMKKDQTRYCESRKDYGHDKKDCRNLKEKIENLIKSHTKGQIARKPMQSLTNPARQLATWRPKSKFRDHGLRQKRKMITTIPSRRRD
ncbi:hypothetical protein LIER_27995 [Lithospermum erythrorhizon]|uniref:Reverse transcriptase domain-containing protein n=1 Tax=Lithospermum erythrorhizon TaxID=34254 RepID=A0AAV3REC5_LITER